MDEGNAALAKSVAAKSRQRDGASGKRREAAAHSGSEMRVCSFRSWLIQSTQSGDILGRHWGEVLTSVVVSHCCCYLGLRKQPFTAQWAAEQRTSAQQVWNTGVKVISSFCVCLLVWECVLYVCVLQIACDIMYYPTLILLNDSDHIKILSHRLDLKWTLQAIFHHNLSCFVRSWDMLRF